MGKYDRLYTQEDMQEMFAAKMQGMDTRDWKPRSVRVAEERVKAFAVKNKPVDFDGMKRAERVDG